MPLYGREQWFDRARKIFLEKKGETIVEIGSIRKIKWGRDGDGHSTFAWAEIGKKVYSVDIDPKATELTKTLFAQYPNVIVVCQDGIEFLNQFQEKIDLLYLDAWDVGTPQYQENHLLAYEAAKPHLHSNSLILIDDVAGETLGKGGLVIPAAIKDGWRIIFQEYQCLLELPMNFPEGRKPTMVD
jgi:predicted O-methyltransferase YrrM